jgi:hypothetical protein
MTVQANPIQPAPSTSFWSRWLLPSAADLVFLGLLFSLSCGVLASRLLGDAGIGWHIRNGQLMLQTHAITRVDPFSSTMSGQPWYAWEWLYDLLIAGVHHWAGLNGVVFLTALVVAATFALTLRLAVARGGDLPLTIVLLALAIGSSAIHLFARPHVFSWLFVVVWFQALDSWEIAPDAAKNRRLLWLPVLMVLWVNVHGGFITGFVLLGIYLVSEFPQLLSASSRSARAPRIKNLAGVTLLSLLATFVNPYGYKLHAHIYRYLTDRFLMNHIEEFRSPNFHDLAPQCFVVLLIITVIALATAREKPRLSQLLTMIFAAGSGLYAARNLPVSSLLLTLTVAPILSRAAAEAKNESETAAWLRGLLARCEAFGSRMGQMEVSLRGHFWPLAGVAFGLWICLHDGKLGSSQIGSSQIMDAHFPAKRFPVQAVDLLVRRESSEPVFCPDYWGGYLIYRLYPQTKVVVDDRHDLYGSQFLKQYLKVTQVEPEWEQVLDGMQVKVVLVPSESGLANVLKESPQWKVVYEDKVGALFQRGAV